MKQNRPVRIAGASGSASDRRHAIAAFAANYPSDPVDVIIGDWLSEANMAALAYKSQLPNEILYEKTFLEALSPALPDIAKYGIKIAVNAGGSDTKGLADVVKKLLKEKGLGDKLKVAWIEGDDVLEVIKEKLQASEKKKQSKWQQIRNAPMGKMRDGMSIFDAWMEGEDVSAEVKSVLSRRDPDFWNICTGEKLQDWVFKDQILAAQAYLGGLGIARAFREGADIVLCGRVSDASPVIGAASWWHNWSREENLEELANALVAGHLIECSNYVCGGNFSGFKALEPTGWVDIGYPIAEIGKRGDMIITKQKGTGGCVSVDTCKAQLLYEIQGPWYFNSDVTAVIDQIAFEHLSLDRVKVSGIKALPPPPTTKVGITADGGFQAEVHWFLVGLDIKDKARMLESQIRHALGDTSRFHVLKFTLNGTAAENPTDQNSATVDFRIFAQAKNANEVAPDNFLRPIIDLIMCSYPGATFHLDFRQGIPKPIQEYFVTLLPQANVQHVVHMHDGRDLKIEYPKRSKTFPQNQPSQDISLVSSKDFGETIRGPLGWLVHARSGDKGSNANVGFWVRHQDEYDWMRILLSTEKMKALLADEYNGKNIVRCFHLDRFELPNILAVHFLLHDHLERGVSWSSTYDFLAKNVAEFLRCRHVDLPKRFLNRGKL
ncbi:DUF1446 domain-containing protein [Mollisia scopiformis]|uniref:DUF1446 domain-containing protein n=1 Tax=Mollisia scopiformis TaxID=149040 RepID=A0A194XKY7_MOLSC|nr:DUF1446 domain-containing protein [Mollisia scopiformis]KUJ20437.1 DUF1446 domain-containing protein [Mollisia scopiformis]